jgi:hypothetical protein
MYHLFPFVEQQNNRTSEQLNIEIKEKQITQACLPSAGLSMMAHFISKFLIQMFECS